MEALTASSIHVSSLRNGRNDLDFSADWRFFRHFEESLVQQGKFEIKVLFDKYPDHWYLHFEVCGEMDTECDRCLAPIVLPVTGSYELYVKFDIDAKPDPSGDIVYVPKETTHFDIAQYLYEFIVLSVPVTKSMDCESKMNPPCDKEMLARLNQQVANDPESTPWDVLKDVQIDRKSAQK